MHRWLASLAAPALATLLMGQAPIPGFDSVALPPLSTGRPALTAYLKRPASSDKPVPAVVAMHGCGGLVTLKGKLQKREAEWADRLVDAGYAVLLPDSFNPRGFREVCTKTEAERAVTPRDRANDLAAAVAWLASQAWIDRERLALIGWSHGGSSTLWSVDKKSTLPGPELRLAIAFYPGCRTVAETPDWSPRLPLTILIGSADNWTRPAYCRAIAMKHPSIRYVEYTGAVHGFDIPDSPPRTRTGLGIVGQAQVGTDYKARSAAVAMVEQLLAAAFR